MKGCGGYCGDLIAPTPTSYDVGGNSGAGVGCPFVNSGELAIAAHNGGHTGNTNSGRFLAAIADGMWAIEDTTALIDFFYASNHKATLAAKAVMQAFYGQAPRYSYFDGCSSGGRAALHEAQRVHAQEDEREPCEPRDSGPHRLHGPLGCPRRM